MNIEREKKKRIIYYSLLVTVVMLLGVSYAYYKLTKTQTNKNNISIRNCLDTTLTEETSEIVLSDAFPISDEDGLKGDPFTFTLTNNCASYVSVDITIDSEYRTSTSTSYLKDEYVKANLVSKGSTSNNSALLTTFSLTDLENSRKGYVLKSIGLNANDSKSFDLRLWLDQETTIAQGLNKSWKGKIVVTVTASSAPTFAEKILADNEVVAPITKPGKEISTSDEALLAWATDDYGSAYYYRGNVQNNYVEYANMCWRIVRTTGDGGVKLVLYNYNGLTPSNKTPTSSSPCSAAVANNNAFARYSGTTYTSAFNDRMNSNAMVGFMYGTMSSSSYNTAHMNVNMSNIGNNLNDWYENVLSVQGGFNEAELSDTIWCNDKYTSDLGYSVVPSAYGGSDRLINGGAPMFKCQYDKNGGNLSRFTVSDTTNGNGALTYKIGLLTADEVVFAGNAWNSDANTTYYLTANTGTDWWTMTPYGFNGNTSMEFYVGGTGTLQATAVVGSYGLRPAIAINDTVSVSGTGTMADPYVIQ